MAGRRVLITAASKGIGRAVADRLAASGDIPVGLARTRPEDFPGEFYQVDLTDRVATPKCSSESRLCSNRNCPNIVLAGIPVDEKVEPVTHADTR